MRIALPFIAIIAVVAIACAVGCKPGAGSERRRSVSSLLTGLLIVLVGTVLLLDRLSIIAAQDVFRFWPVLLIAFGLIGIFTADHPSKLVGRGLIGLFGVLALLMELNIIHATFREIWPVFIIAAGVLIMWSTLFPRSLALRIPPASNIPASFSPHLNVVSIFADGNWTVNAPDFENGYIRAVFGGFKVDMTQANMTGSRAYITLDVVFAGGEIRIPDSWNLLIEAHPVFGACEDKTRRLQPSAATKTLVLQGKVVFGGIEIRN